MKRIYLFTLICFGLLIISCGLLEKEDNETPPEPDILFVQFENEASSVATITSIIVQPMGKAGTMQGEPVGDWSKDVLKSGEKIAPGQKVNFTLEIPNLHWVRYRLALDDGNGGEFWMHEQKNYSESNLPITHWGSDDRTCYVRISKNNETYYIQGWGDNAGIQ